MARLVLIHGTIGAPVKTSLPARRVEMVAMKGRMAVLKRTDPQPGGLPSALPSGAAPDGINQSVKGCRTAPLQAVGVARPRTQRTSLVANTAVIVLGGRRQVA
jgi:hypothetical protein